MKAFFAVALLIVSAAAIAKPGGDAVNNPGKFGTETKCRAECAPLDQCVDPVEVLKECLDKTAGENVVEIEVTVKSTY